MIPNKLLEYYESLVSPAKDPKGQNPLLKEYVAQIREEWERRVIVRELRAWAGIPVCSGEVDCLKIPTSLCVRGEHQTCPDHAHSCYLCLPRAA